MNFSPFSTHFPGIHQFVSTTQENNSSNNNNPNRYTTSHNTSTNTNNLNNFNQTKFRNDLESNVVSTNNIINKYVNQTATTAQYGTVSYSQPQDSKNNIILANSNYQAISNNQQIKDNVIQQHSDLTQDITALLQQTDTKRGDLLCF